MHKEIRLAVEQAAPAGQKLAMFHFQVLKHAHSLEAVDPTSFCREVGVPDSYATEFRQMLAVARVMQQQGISLVRA